MSRRSIAFIVCLALVSSLFIMSSFAAGNTKIVFMNSKGEIQAQLEQAAKVFNQENPGIELSIVTAPVGQSPQERLSALYASGNAPALAMLDGDVSAYKDKWTDLSKEKWVKSAMSGMLNSSTFDGKVMTFPFCIEGFGFIYNKAILDKAGVDPATIKTTAGLKVAFEKVKASGVDPLVVCREDWSLANHFLAVAYGDQSKKPADVEKFLSDLKAGKVDLARNKIYNGLMATLDVMKAYNSAAKDPMSADYNKCAELIGTGKVGFYMQGTWVWGMIQNFNPKGVYGYVPIPISDNAADYGNSGIPVGPTKLVGIDKSNNTKAQQAAAKKFLNWLVSAPSGRKAWSTDMALAAPFKGVPAPADPLNQSLLQYAGKGRTVEFVATLGGDHFKIIGASMQKYLLGAIDKAGLAKEIETWWKTQK